MVLLTVRRLSLFFLLFLLWNAAPLALAAPGFKDVSLPAEIREGQQIRLQLTFEWASAEGDYEFKAPADVSTQNLKLLEPSRFQDTSSPEPEQVSRTVLLFQLAPGAAGQGRIDSFDVRYRKPGSTSWNKISVPSIVLDIKPALPLTRIFILIAIILAIMLPLALWLVQSSAAAQKHDQDHPEDPKKLSTRTPSKLLKT